MKSLFYGLKLEINRPLRLEIIYKYVEEIKYFKIVKIQHGGNEND